MNARHVRLFTMDRSLSVDTIYDEFSVCEYGTSCAMCFICSKYLDLFNVMHQETKDDKVINRKYTFICCHFKMMRVIGFNG
jgi:hypothetical protein